MPWTVEWILDRTSSDFCAGFGEYMGMAQNDGLPCISVVCVIEYFTMLDFVYTYVIYISVQAIYVYNANSIIVA